MPFRLAFMSCATDFADPVSEEAPAATSSFLEMASQGIQCLEERDGGREVCSVQVSRLRSEQTCVFLKTRSISALSQSECPSYSTSASVRSSKWQASPK